MQGHAVTIQEMLAQRYEHILNSEKVKALEVIADCYTVAEELGKLAGCED